MTNDVDMSDAAAKETTKAEVTKPVPVDPVEATINGKLALPSVSLLDRANEKSNTLLSLELA